MSGEHQDRALRAAELRRFDGEAPQFWARFLQLVVDSAGGERGLLVLSQGEDSGWKPVARWPRASGAFALPMALDSADFERLAEGAFEQGAAFAHRVRGGDLSVLALGLETGEEASAAGGTKADADGGGARAIALVVFERGEREWLGEAAARLAHLADVPRAYHRSRLDAKARSDAERLTRVLDVLAEVNRHDRFLAAAMAMVNEIQARFGCHRVSLGWRHGEYLRVQAISHMDRFDPKMDAVQDMEACMEESADQDCEVVTPASGAATFISRAHEAFARKGGGPEIASVPLHVRGDDEDVAGVVLLERDADRGHYTELELASLRVLADQAAPKLADLRHRDRWWGARATEAGRRGLARILGFEHTWAKLFALLGAIALAVTVFGRAEYRVEAEFIIRSDDLTHLPAPFDGFLSEVDVRVGDQVDAGEVLVALDTADLELQEAATVAQIQRYRSEAEKAESSGNLAEMRVALAMLRQSKANLDLVRYRLERSAVKAPFSGIIVAGDLRDRIGTPVQTGEILMRLTRLEDLYVEMKVEERDIDEVIGRPSAEIAFASRPEEKFPVEITVLEPAAVPEPAGNRFVARGRPVEGAQPWWRPGMTGVAKINTGKRTFLWIFTHRLVDFLRMKLWW